jgi:tRNA G18 (ribose-2'-O)-methylase SpoU
VHVHRITTINIPDLEPYLTLREQTHHWQGGHVVAEGEKAVRALLESDVPVVSMLLSDDWFEKLAGVLQSQRFEATQVYVAPDDLLEGIVGFRMHKRILAIGEEPPNVPLAELAAAPGVIVALEGIADAENMGMILRNCAAFGAAGLVVGPDSSSPWLRRSVRVSLGNVFSLRIHRAVHVHEALAELRSSHRVAVVGTSPRGGTASLPSAVRLCLLFGGEAYGLTREAFALCDSLFTIPMHCGVDSINVANSVAVGLFAASARTAE